MLKSMKIEKEAAEKMYGPATAVAEAPQYPYGLRLSLDNAALEKLGIEMPEVGDKMKMLAQVEVVGTSAYDAKEGGKRLSVELQITDMGIKEMEEKEESGEEVKPPPSPDAFYGAPEMRG